jgi:hypothetical protein
VAEPQALLEEDWGAKFRQLWVKLNQQPSFKKNDQRQAPNKGKGSDSKQPIHARGAPQPLNPLAPSYRSLAQSGRSDPNSQRPSLLDPNAPVPPPLAFQAQQSGHTQQGPTNQQQQQAQMRELATYLGYENEFENYLAQTQPDQPPEGHRRRQQ